MSLAELPAVRSIAAVTQYGYDDAGNLTTLTDSLGNTTTFGYDALGRRVSDTNEPSGTRTWVYDASGNVTAQTDRNGRVSEYDYDALGRLTEERWLDGSSATIYAAAFTYDADSRLLTAGDALSGYTYTYDTLGRVTETVFAAGALPAVTLAAAYDAASNRTSLATTIGSQADALTSYSYDTLGRMTSIQQEDADALAGAAVREKRVDLTWNAAGQRVSSTRYEDLAGTELVALTTNDYDTAGRLVGLEHVQGTTTLAGYTWTYDAAGRITQTVSSDGTVDFTYDDTNQLTGADYSAQADETYTYDANGNRTGTGHTTGDNNRLLSDGTYNYEYDAEGNRTKRTEIATGDYVQYTWDHRNRLTLVVFRDDLDAVLKQVAYEYDVFDRRITKLVDADGDDTFEREEHYVYDAAGKTDGVSGAALDDVILVLDDAGDVQSRVLHGPNFDEVFATETTADLLWTLTDHQGTVRDVVDYDLATDIAEVVNHITYNAFGQFVNETDPGTSLAPTKGSLGLSDPADQTILSAFTGREWDADAQLYYYRARWYDANTGKFLSEDPLGFDAGDANLSRYVGNGATYLVDPSGLEEVDEAAQMQALFDSIVSASPSGSGGDTFVNFDGETVQACVPLYQNGNVVGSMGTVGPRAHADSIQLPLEGPSADRVYDLARTHYVNNHDPATSDVLMNDGSVRTVNREFLDPLARDAHERDGLLMVSPNESYEMRPVDLGYLTAAEVDNIRRDWGAAYDSAYDQAFMEKNSGRILANIFISVGVGMVPGAGQVQDVAILMDPKASALEKLIAGGSLILDTVLAGVLPNFGGLGRAAGTPDIRPGGAIQTAAGFASPGSAIRSGEGVAVLRSGDNFTAAGSLNTGGAGRVTTTIDELRTSGTMPGQTGVRLKQRTVLFDDIWELSVRDGVEYVLTREGGHYILRNGTNNSVLLPSGVRPIVHTHPPDVSGFVDKTPSIADINVLNQVWKQNPSGSRPISQIVTGPGETTVFRATGMDPIPKPKVRK